MNICLQSLFQSDHIKLGGDFPSLVRHFPPLTDTFPPRRRRSSAYSALVWASHGRAPMRAFMSSACSKCASALVELAKRRRQHA